MPERSSEGALVFKTVYSVLPGSDPGDWCAAPGMQPVLWQQDVPPPLRGTVIAHQMATNSTSWMQGRYCRISVPIDTVVVHGRPELELAIKPETFLNGPVVACFAAAGRVTNRAGRHGTARPNLYRPGRAEPGTRVQTGGAVPGDLPLGRAGPPGGSGRGGVVVSSRRLR